jgi:hypothetical protein
LPEILQRIIEHEPEKCEPASRAAEKIALWDSWLQRDKLKAIRRATGEACVYRKPHPEKISDFARQILCSRDKISCSSKIIPGSVGRHKTIHGGQDRQVEQPVVDSATQPRGRLISKSFIASCRRNGGATKKQ